MNWVHHVRPYLWNTLLRHSKLLTHQKKCLFEYFISNQLQINKCRGLPSILYLVLICQTVSNELDEGDQHLLEVEVQVRRWRLLNVDKCHIFNKRFLIKSCLHIYLFQSPCNRIGDVMVSVHVSSAVDCGLEPRSGQTKEYKIAICCFSAKRSALRSKVKTGWLGIRIMCPSGATCLSADCCYSELAL